MPTLTYPEPTYSDPTAASGTEITLGPLAQIPLGEGRNFQVGGTEIAVFHTRQGVYATQAECPHRKGPLADGLVGGTSLVCPFHAWKFDLQTGDALMGQCGIQTYPVRVTEGGDLWLTLTGDIAPACSLSKSEEIGVSQTPVGSATGPADAWAA